jgi:hypothetical protein
VKIFEKFSRIKKMKDFFGSLKKMPRGYYPSMEQTPFWDNEFQLHFNFLARDPAKKKRPHRLHQVAATILETPENELPVAGKNLCEAAARGNTRYPWNEGDLATLKWVRSQQGSLLKNSEGQIDE